MKNDRPALMRENKIVMQHPSLEAPCIAALCLLILAVVVGVDVLVVAKDQSFQTDYYENEEMIVHPHAHHHHSRNEEEDVVVTRVEK